MWCCATAISSSRLTTCVEPSAYSEGVAIFLQQTRHGLVGRACGWQAGDTSRSRVAVEAGL